MANKVRPIKPNQVAKQKKADFPDAVFEAFNELIAEDFAGKTARVGQKEVVELMAKKGLNRNEIYKKGWLNIEETYEKAGWEVDYDRPGYNETYPAAFTFTARR
jgi:hypothetical protein